MHKGSESNYSGYPREAEDLPKDIEDHTPCDGGANYQEAGRRSVAGRRREHIGPWSLEYGVQ